MCVSMETSLCRVCLVSYKNIVNIFETAHESGISIAYMISRCTDYKVDREDKFPKSICVSCLEDVQNAFEIIETYERSHQFYSFFKDLREEECEDEGSHCFEEGPIKDEETNGDNWTREFPDQKENCGSYRSYSQLSNEGTEGDLEETNLKGSDDCGDDTVYKFCIDDGKDKTKVKLSLNCSYCPKTFPTKSKLEIHFRSHKKEMRPFKCSHCTKCFATRQVLTNHFLTHTGERPFKCSQCPKAFGTNGNLKRHLTVHTGDRPSFPCSHCLKSFISKQRLTIHLRSHLKKENRSALQCSYCLKPFVKNFLLQKHLRTHTGERPFKCSHCSKTFGFQPNLKRHLLIHTGERPFDCSHCSKRFQTKEHLKRHFLTHTGERPFQCSTCSKSFTQKISLKIHMRTHTGERPFKCSHCSKDFTLCTSLKRHLIIHTKKRSFKRQTA
ncbi:zinc finger protein 501 isoform X1 [Drosophila rhopaloa]|uniref:Zinc finger protein 501 isoform X1 n=2 Tax=Drosophila rhopaloa TaxID=1041015 RepID=A0A6P4E6H5_DRORH|nr:zinc finger protein 501 isoform X1 [Drosophila rhopaloa]